MSSRSDPWSVPLVPELLDPLCGALRLAELRALACVNRTCCAHVTAYVLGLRVVRVDYDDCTQANADFVLGTLRVRNPVCVLQVGDGCCLRPLAQVVDPNRPPPMVIVNNLSLAAGFFLGRALALRKSGVVREEHQYVNDRGALAPRYDDVLVERILNAYDEPGYKKGDDPDRDGYPLYMHGRSDMNPGGWAALAGPYLAEALRVYEAKEGSSYGSLELKHVYLDDEGAAWLAKHVEAQLKHKYGSGLHHLDYNKCVSPYSWGLFKPLMRGVFGADLWHLDLSENRLGEDGMAMLRECVRDGGLPRVSTLDLDCTCLCDAAMDHLTRAFEQLGDRLRTLRIGGNKFTDVGMNHFMWYGHHLRRLRKLDLIWLPRAVTFHKINVFAHWIRDQTAWEGIEEIKLFPPDDPMDPTGTIEGCCWMRDAHGAVLDAVRLRAAENSWNQSRPNPENLLKSQRAEARAAYVGCVVPSRKRARESE